MAITGFRDPSIWRQGEWYYMTVGSGVAKVGGCVLLYRSPVKGDLKQWEYLHPLTSGVWNGKTTANPCDDGEMWECPEFFALGAGHVLIYSTLGKVFWQSGELDAATMRFKPKHTGELDLGAFYAPKTQLDAQGRRILWGWIPEKRSEEAMRAAGWSGMMSLPRVMSLDADGILRLTIAEQMKMLRAGPLKMEGSSSGVGVTLPAANGELLCSGARGKGFALRLGTQADAELVKVEYVAERHVFVADGQEIALQPYDAPTIHAFVDGSVIEMILGERIGLTKRFYYPGAAPDVSAMVESKDESVKLAAWKIAPISSNRMTSVAITERRSA
jgi:beta-fructofuranosidase